MTMTTATPPATPTPDLTADDALLVAAQLHPTAFVLAMKGGKYRPAWFHWRIGDALAAVAAGRCRRLMIFMPPQYGKALAVDTPIPTPAGWQAIGDLRPGDQVFDEQGLPRTVVAVSPVWRDRPVYTVMTDDGDAIVADAAHEWRARLDGKRPVFKIHTTERIARPRVKRALIERQGALQLPDVPMPVDPYVLGLWLGDGTAQHATITAGTEDWDAVRAQIEACGYTLTERATAHTFGIRGIQARLRALGLLHNKHIPPSYLRASAAQRLALLQGLVDSDGYVSPRGQIEFCSINQRLAADVHELVCSLGRKATILAGRATLGGRDCGMKYRVMFTMANAARLPRKAARCRDATKTLHRYVSAEPCGTAATVCIQVASPSHLFLAGRSMLPTHNSELVSRNFPPWHFGRHPERSIIATSYGADLAEGFGRDARHVIESPEYRAVFPGVQLARDAKAADHWAMAGHDGRYFAAGVGGPITGRGADVLIIDDPIKDVVEANSETTRAAIWDWYRMVAYPRVREDGSIVLIQCMTGDTPVLMETGHEKPLRDVRSGDRVATYDDGNVSVSTVRNWTNNGPDRVYEIRMKSGTIVKANARHPFLVKEGDETRWRRTATLSKGSAILRVIGASGEASPAPLRDATSPPSAKARVPRTITSVAGRPAFARLRSILGLGAKGTFATVTGLASQSMSAFWLLRAEHALSASSRPPRTTCPPTGAGNFALTIATIAKRFEGFSATPATSLSATEKLRPSCSPLLSTYEITGDAVVEVIERGIEDVFDVEIERTGNFIAGGLVSHNTRWHEDDLAGRLLAEQARGGDRWRVLELPARGEDGAALWPEKHDRAALEQVERVVGPYAWQALYQQRPAPAEGSVLKDWWWRYWCWEGQEDTLPPVRVRTPEGEQLIRARQIPAGFDIELQSWDMAFKDTKSSAYVVGQVWGRERADFYLRDQVREKMDFVATQAAVRETTRLWPRALLKLVEDKANGPAIIASLNEEIAGFDAVEPRGSKESRMQAVAPAIASGHVYIPHPAIAPWVPGFLAECAVAPYGRYMDQVDTMSQALDRLAHSALAAPVDRHGSIPIVSARALARGAKGVRRR
jgi:predicted phage terminase large subunit-like protein